ncbi:DUF7221 family queuine tRNA-ribosyltransferase-like protein [Umezawaea tangerina]|uniref:DeoxyPurine in DNA protein A domain-containing protein n=1 Tax=Umezawaea tangerina TaxID=84725 RepID=A0A2T0SPH1_9PSEU|nr:hypothetical protein [Umezawaea tangerina]PRY35305.1 hypothetical protein CLV43_114223 [Umezawaea tangerina]
MIRFYLGTHQPHWLETAGVPLFVSHRRLAKRRSLPRAAAPWALDSGGFSELSLYGEWRTTPAEYVAAVRRYDEEIGWLEWAAPQDSMCEDAVLAKTGLTELEHQRRTVINFQRLQDLWYAATSDESPFMPVLQAKDRDGYLRCADLYAAAGIDLCDYELVGVGSVCRRQATGEIHDIVTALRSVVDPELPLHGFGVKTRGLRLYGDQLTTADSLAWSYDARRGQRMDGCTSHTNCANCLRYALAWRQRVLELPATHYEPFGALAC